MLGAITESNEGNNCGAWTDVVVAAANAVPTVTTPTATAITSTGATLGANVTSLGVPAAISARGTCWGTTAAPTTNCTAASGLTTGIFTHARTSMPAGTLIYYRGYAINTTGTGYSVDASFTTSSLPDLTAGAPSPATATAGTALTFTTTISNIGAASTGASFNNVLRVATAAGGGGTVSYPSATSLAALGPGASNPVTSATYTFPSAGTYSVNTCADNNTSMVGAITESNEGNNCGAWTDVVVGSAFNYNLTNSGTSNVPKTSGNAFGTNIITKTVTSGTDPGVTLSLTGHPAGVTYSSSAWSCAPTCTSTITFTVPPTTTVGTYSITVTGSPLNRTTIFDLVITGNPMVVTCVGTPSPAQLGQQNVTWTGTVVSGGTGPFSYSWVGTDIPTSPVPTANPYIRTYSTIGDKTAQVTVTDVDSVVSSCNPVATVQVNFDPSFEEF
jgi:plastocyanin